MLAKKLLSFTSTFQLEKRGNVCCQCESIYNMFVLQTTGE